MVMEKLNFFKNFKKSLIGGHDEKLKNFGMGFSRRKTEKFWQIEKKIIELDNLRKKFFLKKNFQNRDSKCHFSTDFEQ